jgi:hypothetical protein
LKMPNGDFKTIGGSADFNQVVDIINTSVKPDPFPPADTVGPNTTVVQNRSFVGGSNFWYSTRQVFGLDYNGQPKTTPFSFEEYNNEVKLSFQLKWRFAKERRPTVPPKFLEKSGFTAAWIQCVLFKCFGFRANDPTVTQDDMLSFRPYNGSDAVELSWTLGRLVLFAVGESPQQMTGAQARELNRLRGLAHEQEARYLRLGDAGFDMGMLLDNYAEDSKEEEGVTELEPKFIKLLTEYELLEMDLKELEPERQMEVEKEKIANALAELPAKDQLFLPLGL